MMPPVGELTGRGAVEWLRTRNRWSTAAPWIRTHPWRMYMLGSGAQWFQPPSRFVIVTPGRSGSELLTDLLNSHPDIVCDAEILRDRVLLPERFVAGRATKARLGGAGAYGFKIHCGHFGYQALRERQDYLSRLSAAGVDIIFLRRRDLLAQAVSSAIASRTRWHWRLQDHATFKPLELDPVEVLMMTYLFEESDQYLRHLLSALPHLTLTYEADLMDPASQQATVDRICDRLGVAHAATSSDHVRFTPRTLAETVANFDELADVIAPTRFRRFLPGGDGHAAESEPAVEGPAGHRLEQNGDGQSDRLHELGAQPQPQTARSD